MSDHNEISHKEYLYSDCQITIHSPTATTISFNKLEYYFDEKDKPKFDAGLGEVVTEYTGFSVDQNPHCSWAKAVYHPKGRSRPHFHKEHTEDYYIISGRATVIIDKHLRVLNAGDQIRILPNQIHQVINASETEGLTLIVKCVPSWTNTDFNLVETDTNNTITV